MRLPISYPTYTTQATTTASSMGGYGTKKTSAQASSDRRTSFGSMNTAASSVSSTTAPNETSVHTSSNSNSRRSFKGRNSFRKTLMLRKANNNSISTNSQRGQLLESTFSPSDCDHHSLTESREGNNHSPPLPLNRSTTIESTTQQQGEAAVQQEADAFPNRLSVSSLKAKSQSSSTNNNSNSGDIPIGHVETILSVFGNDDSSFDPLDLYRDVLDVSPDASERDVRIAYFRRGREVLSVDGIDAANEASAVASGVMDPATRTKFQAVSMAYEILSNPAWKQQYLENGGLVMPAKTAVAAAKSSPRAAAAIPRSSAPLTIKDRIKLKAHANMQQRISSGAAKTAAASTNRPTSSSLRESSFRDGIRKSLLTGKSSAIHQRQSSVRWSEHVEELVFEHDPNEHVIEDDDDTSYDTEEEDTNDHKLMMRDFLLIGESKRGPSPCEPIEEEPKEDTPRSSPATSTLASSVSTFIGKRKKNKPRVIIESDELESHLQRMDDEAEKHFVQDFFDTFEESMSGVLSLVDSFADAKAKSQKRLKQSEQKAGNCAPTGLGRSMSHDTADLERGREKKEQAAAVPASSLEDGADGLVKRSKSFDPSMSDRIAVDSSDVAYDDSINGSTQIGETPTKSHPGATVVSPTSVRAYPPSGTMTPSQSSRSGSMFRPISPSVSEASDLLTIRSGQFSLESLGMSDMENPFRESSSSTHPGASTAMSADPEDSEIISESVKEVDESFDTVGATTIMPTSPTPPVKSRRVAISAVSTSRKVSEQDPAAAEKKSNDDVFDGLDEQAKAKGPMGMSLQRSNSMAASECLSDLSESVFQYNMATNPPKPRVSFQNDHPGRGGADTPLSETSEGTTVTSNIPPRRTIGRSFSESSIDSTGDPLSAMDLLSSVSVGDGETVQSVETAMEANGFFEYFVAYVSAIVTECTSDSNGPDFGQDIMSLFSKPSSEEEREPPARTQSTASSVTSIDA